MRTENIGQPLIRDRALISSCRMRRLTAPAKTGMPTVTPRVSAVVKMINIERNNLLLRRLNAKGKKPSNFMV